MEDILSENTKESPLPVIVSLSKQKGRNEPSAKKPKFERAASNEQVLGFVQKCAEENWTQEDSKDPCYPSMLSETWNREFLNQLFREKQQIVLDNVRSDDDPRAPLVITVVAGYGHGKTHFLKVAPWLVGQESLFVTYNQEQDLATDVAEPRKALLLRIILGTFGTGSFGAANFLTSETGKNVAGQMDYSKLLDIAAERLTARFASSTGFLICVDEVRKLEWNKLGTTSELLSTLGALALRVYKLPSKLQCTALVSALDKEGITIYTQSNRTVEPIRLPPADRSAVELVARVLGLAKEHLWKVIAVGGSHFRSIVTAVNVLKGNSHVDIERLVNLTFERLRQTLDHNTIVAIGDYLKATMEHGGEHAANDNSPLVVSNCTTDGAIPPALICVVCSQNEYLRSHNAAAHALGIFHNDIANAAFDQLELSAMHFDLLRSAWRLPVVPLSMKVTDDPGWYSDLRFPLDMESSEEGILESKDKEVAWTGLVPSLGTYYHPELSNHPWLDRFFVVKTKEEQRCLVLYQDKINAAGFPEAVNDLNLAAEILTKALKLPVLCIANVISASERTRSQSNFAYPYLLVRDSELDKYYTSNFSPVMRFLRTRFRDQGAKRSICARTAPTN